ncbi:DUF3376 domain-containing protein, partial [Frankia sp. CcWB2]
PMPPTPPAVIPTLLQVLGAALNQSIGTDLATLRDHNSAVRGTRANRRRLLRLAPAGGPRLADESVYDAYRRSLAEETAPPVIEALLRVLGGRFDLPRPPDTDALRTDAAGPVRMTNAAVNAVVQMLPDRLPTTADLADLWRLGRPALDAAKGLLINTINEGYVLSPEPADRIRLARLAAAVHGASRATIRNTGTAGTAGTAALRPGVFTTVGETLGAMAGAPLLDVIAEAARRWLRTDPEGDAGQDELTDLVDRRSPAAPPPAGPETRPEGLSLGQRRAVAARTLADFVGYLPSTPADALIAVHLVERSTGAAVLDQPVELVQISADLPNRLDPARALAEEKVTGLQLGNFGAFAKSSWRANDWMWGRLDGAGWLVRIMLDPRRLMIRRDTAIPAVPAGHARAAALARRGWLVDLVDDLTEVAGSPAPREVLDELGFLTDPDAPVPPNLPVTATWVAAGLQRDIAAKELVGVAEAVRRDNEAGVDPRPTADFLAAVDRALTAEPTRPGTTTGPGASAAPEATGPPNLDEPRGAKVISLAAAAAARVAAGRTGAHRPVGVDSSALARRPPRPPGLSGVPVTPGALPPRAVDEVLEACRVSDERITDAAQGPILVTALAQIVAVVVAWAASTRRLPRPLRPVAFLARAVTRLAFEMIRDVTHGRRRMTIAVGTAMVGLGTAGGLTGSGILGGLGIVVGLIGLLMIGLTGWRHLPGGLAVVGAGLIAVFAAAGAVPVIHDRLFPWLHDDVVPYLADHPWAWATVFGALVLPALWSVAEALTTRRARRNG